jgi:Ca2+-binding RTX toxin-like protein
MRTVRVTVVLTSFVLLGLAPAARADGTVSQDGTTITYQSQAGDQDRFLEKGSIDGVRFGPALPPDLQPDGVAINHGLGCIGTGAVLCDFFGLATLNLGDGDDLAGVMVINGPVPATTINGGTGKDLIGGLSAGLAPLTLLGDEDDDVLVDGDAADTLDGGSGNDTLRYLAGGADDIRGGADTDTIQFNPATAIVVSLDDVANDGPAGTANVHHDIETVEGTPLGDQITGGAGANTLDGNDGNDTITARDGVADAVDCGAGTDTAVVDFADVVSNCENVQLPDTDGDGSTDDVDCDDLNPAIHPGAVDVPGDGIDQDCSGADAAIPDSDGDGVNDNLDCNDGNPAIHPGAVDIPGDGIDQDCSGGPTGGGGGATVLPKVAAQIQASWTLNKAYAKLARLNVSKVPAGGKVEVLCSGKGCAFSRRAATVKGGKASLAKLFKARKLKPGAVIEIRVTAPGKTGQVVRFTVRKGKKTPTRSTLCLAAGAAKPAACA